MQRYTYTGVFTEALFVSVKNFDQAECALLEGEISKLVYICILK